MIPHLWRFLIILLSLSLGETAWSLPLKVLHLNMSAAETGFDPVTTSDLNTASIEAQLYDSVLTYDYLARPVRLVPRLATEMPEVTHQGTVWVIHLKKGVYFAPNELFGPHSRLLTVGDVIYTIKRFMDPVNRSPYKFLFAGKIMGLDQLSEEAKKTGHFDYDRPIVGLQKIDDDTLRIQLTATDYNFGHALAQPVVGVVCREVIEHYGPDAGSHPVGTGPYLLAKWVRASRITLEKNPGYRPEFWAFEPNKDPLTLSLVQEMKGKKIPQIDQIDIQMIDEPQSAWLSFSRGELDLLGLSGQLAPVVLDHEKLREKWIHQGIQLNRLSEPMISYFYFNYLDPDFGGDSKSHIALRRAIFMSIDDDEMIRVLFNGQAIREQYPVPPGVAGYDPQYESILGFNPELANLLLDQEGYQRGKDGWRQGPNGQVITVRFTSGVTSQDREIEAFIRKSLSRIGLAFSSEKLRFPDILRLERQCRLQFRLSGWIADYPDGDNFMQLWYGPHTHENNGACYQNAQWDALYDQSILWPQSSERDELYHQMARMLELDGITKISSTAVRNVLTQSWVLGYSPHPILASVWQYLDITPHGVNP